jgi:FkbM family methyltransferase
MRSSLARLVWDKVCLRTFSFGARYRWLGRLAFLVRHVATVQVRHRLVSSMDPTENGEAWLLSTFGAQFRRVFDIGANVGDWSRQVLQSCPSVELLICYEPSPVISVILRNNLASDARVAIIESAVSDSPGVLDYYDQPSDAQTSSLISQWSTKATKLRVPVVTVDEEMRRLGLDTIDLLKSDVEGYDLHVLRGARAALERHAIGMVQFEYNRPWMFAGSTLQAANAFLSELGYEIFLLNGTGLCRCDIRSLGELFEYLNFVAIPADQVARLATVIHPDPLWG